MKPLILPQNSHRLAGCSSTPRENWMIVGDETFLSIEEDCEPLIITTSIDATGRPHSKNLPAPERSVEGEPVAIYRINAT
jgi:hypothetical protein